jgi:ribA/ribD-fused uncharacterized protein
MDQTSTPPIRTFFGEHRFLSNFWPATFMWRGKLWLTSEHAYQAAKTLDPQEQDHILNLPTAGQAKRAGKTVTLREDWETVKVAIMTEIVFEKFNQNPELKKRLLNTGDAVLEEGNTWGDKTWGISPPGSGKGKNLLGVILMRLRTLWRLEDGA